MRSANGRAGGRDARVGAWWQASSPTFDPGGGAHQLEAEEVVGRAWRTEDSNLAALPHTRLEPAPCKQAATADHESTIAALSREHGHERDVLAVELREGRGLLELNGQRARALGEELCHAWAHPEWRQLALPFWRPLAAALVTASEGGGTLLQHMTGGWPVMTVPSPGPARRTTSPG